MTATAYCSECGYHVAGAAFCAQCGSPQAVDSGSLPAPPTAFPAPEAAAPADGSAGATLGDSNHQTSRVVCPICRSADAIRRVSTVIDEGQSQTAGVSQTVYRGRVAHSSHVLATRGELARRLTIRNRPQDEGRSIAVGTFPFALVIGIGIQAFLMSETAVEKYQGFMIALVFLSPAITAGCYYAFSGIHAKQREYSARMKEARLGYYCARDDVAFLPGGPARSPEAYAASFAQRGRTQDVEPQPAAPAQRGRTKAVVVGVLLGLVAIGQFISAFVMLAGSLTGSGSRPPLHFVVAGLILAASTAYLVWLAVRGRRALFESPLADSTRNILIGYGVLALVIRPVLYSAVYR